MDVSATAVRSSQAWTPGAESLDCDAKRVAPGDDDTRKRHGMDSLNQPKERWEPSAPVTSAFPGISRPRRRLYRSRKGMVFGVCKGFAEYAELPVFWIRFIMVCLTILSWILPFVILYVVAAFWMRPEPVLEPEAEEDWRTYVTSACAQSQGLAQLQRYLDDVEARALRLERQASARQFDWERRLRGEP